MTELQCKNCGAPLGADGKCHYCGTVYQLDYNGPEVRYVEIHSSPVQTLTVKKTISGEMARHMHEDILYPGVLGEMRRDLANALQDAMKIVVKHDMDRDVIIVRGTVRVVPPDFRF